MLLTQNVTCQKRLQARDIAHERKCSNVPATQRWIPKGKKKKAVKY